MSSLACAWLGVAAFALPATAVARPVIHGVPVALRLPVYVDAQRVTALDAQDDAVFRRVDATGGMPLPMPSGVRAPELMSVTLEGWQPVAPAVNPYVGSGADIVNPDFVRIEVVFRGHVNPPGPLGLSGQPFQPYRFGPNPVYGFIEIDVDADINTGGELVGTAEQRYLANVARFGGMPLAPRTNRAAKSGSDMDRVFSTPPFVERSGCDWVVALCGCFAMGRTAELAGNGDTVFELGESWLLRGRLFRRAGGYQAGSAAFGGSGFGLYDPLVEARFTSIPGANPTNPLIAQTVIEIVYPLTMQGAALLSGDPEEPIDADVSNHTSIVESLVDLIDGAAPTLTDPTWTLQSRWSNRVAGDYLTPSAWSFTAIVGTAYPQPGPHLYIWSDVGFDMTTGDMDASDALDSADQDVIGVTIATYDGGPEDADGETDGAYTLLNHAANFQVADLDGNGVVDGFDRYNPIYPVLLTLPGDVDHDGAVGLSDIALIIQFWSLTVQDGTSGDANNDGIVDLADLAIVIGNWGAVQTLPDVQPIPDQPID